MRVSNGSLIALLVLACSLTGCQSSPARRSDSLEANIEDCSQTNADCAAIQLARAQAAARDARHARSRSKANYDFMRCAVAAGRAMSAERKALGAEAAQLATHCTKQFLRPMLEAGAHFASGDMQWGRTSLQVEMLGLSRHLEEPVTLTLASEEPMAIFGGVRHTRSGFGVPVALMAPRCSSAPACELFPAEGIFESATVWLATDPTGRKDARLVIADPFALGALEVAGGRRYALAADSSAWFARGAGTSKLHRLAVWGLLWGDEIARRAGVYLLEDYDPRKRPLVMIHGLGSSPLIWARLSNEVWGDPALRAHFQVWHVVYQTDAPLLVARLRLERYLDEAWQILDPERDDPARAGMVLIGHSMGGVIARLMCVESGDRLWSAAFTVPPAALVGDRDDIETLQQTFVLRPYPGIARAIFIAAPHHGSPIADQWYGQLARFVVGRGVPEIEGLARIAKANPDAVRAALRSTYQRAQLNSIATMQADQPVRRAGEMLLPVPGIAYHSIAGVLPRIDPPSDGVVPLASTELPGTSSTLIVAAGHDVEKTPEAVAEIVRILHEDLAHREILH
jgi:pimeloyl-ACP methyl ester carboxylesterase